jgi:hypothetical protein
MPKFGLPWQVVPSQIRDWVNGDDPAMVKRVSSKVWAMESSTSPSYNARRVALSQRRRRRITSIPATRRSRSTGPPPPSARLTKTAVPPSSIETSVWPCIA